MIIEVTFFLKKIYLIFYECHMKINQITPLLDLSITKLMWVDFFYLNI